MLAVEVSFLTGRYVATAFDDRRESEWPPHPARLFSALAATCLTEESVDPRECRALEWLESLPAPEICASQASQREVVTVYVPVNDAHQTRDLDEAAEAVDTARAAIEAAQDPKARTSASKKLEKAESRLQSLIRSATSAPDPASDSAGKGKKKAPGVLPESRVRQPRTFPSVTPTNPVVTFVWRQAEPTEEHFQTLDALLARLVRLGHSSSLVSARLVQQAPRSTWFPSDRGDKVIRTTRTGQLQELRSAWERHRETEPRIIPAVFCTYGVQSAAQVEVAPQTCFEAAGLVLQRSRGPRLPISAGPNLARAVRRLLLSMAPEPIPETICGHRADGSPSERDHLAVVPLPFVGHRHATGDLLGLTLLLPREVTPEDRRALHLAIDAWERAHRGPDDERDAPEVPVHLGPLGSWYVRRLEDEARPATLDLHSWTRPSRTWCSVTPVALDRHPGPLGARDARKRLEAVARATRTVEAAVQRVGLPRPIRVGFESDPLLAGSASARSFGRFPADPARNPLALTHVRLEFAEPVRGPLLVGAGRYLGLGLFRPVQTGDEC